MAKSAPTKQAVNHVERHDFFGEFGTGGSECFGGAVQSILVQLARKNWSQVFTQFGVSMKRNVSFRVRGRFAALF